MLAKEIVSRFVDSVAQTADAHEAYLSDTRWTTIATGALIRVGQEASSGIKVRAAARGFKDPNYERSEYLTLDVCVYDDDTWGPPLFIAEHENSRYLKKVQYCAWKLLATEATRRVLVAYYDSKKVDRKKFAALVAKVQEVAKANPGSTAPRDVVVIAAPWGARPGSVDALRELFDYAIVGKRS